MFKPRFHTMLKLEFIKHLEHEVVLSVEHELLKSWVCSRPCSTPCSSINKNGSSRINVLKSLKVRPFREDTLSVQAAYFRVLSEWRTDGIRHLWKVSFDSSNCTFWRTFVKCNRSSDKHRKTSDNLLLVAAFSATGTIHLQLLQNDSILFPLQSQDSRETCLQKLKLCGLAGRFISCHPGH